MDCILLQLNELVLNAAASNRLSEECSVLSLVLAQQGQTVVLSEFKAVMLASMRSLLAKERLALGSRWPLALKREEWSSQHEVSW